MAKTVNVDLSYHSSRPFHLRDNKGVSVHMTGMPDMSRRYFKRRNGFWVHINDRAYHFGWKKESKNY